MKSLNSKFRRKNKSTDVLSFPIKNIVKNNSYIGDIAICFEIINKRSKSSNFFLEFDKMWIHGYFHLIGYDHKKLKDFEKMSKKENLILQHFHKIN
jgi:probable rRNA maturation factor